MDSWNAIVDYTKEIFGGITGLLKNAGVEQKPGSPIHKTDTDEFMRVVNVNYKDVFLGIKAVVQEIINAGSGSIVNIGAGGSITGTEFMVDGGLVLGDATPLE